MLVQQNRVKICRTYSVEMQMKNRWILFKYTHILKEQKEKVLNNNTNDDFFCLHKLKKSSKISIISEFLFKLTKTQIHTTEYIYNNDKGRERARDFITLMESLNCPITYIDNNIGKRTYNKHTVRVEERKRRTCYFHSFIQSFQLSSSFTFFLFKAMTNNKKYFKVQIFCSIYQFFFAT